MAEMESLHFDIEAKANTSDVKKATNDIKKLGEAATHTADSALKLAQNTSETQVVMWKLRDEAGKLAEALNSGAGSGEIAKRIDRMHTYFDKMAASAERAQKAQNEIAKVQASKIVPDVTTEEAKAYANALTPLTALQHKYDDLAESIAKAMNEGASTTKIDQMCANLKKVEAEIDSLNSKINANNVSSTTDSLLSSYPALFSPEESGYSISFSDAVDTSETMMANAEAFENIQADINEGIAAGEAKMQAFANIVAKGFQIAVAGAKKFLTVLGQIAGKAMTALTSKVKEATKGFETLMSSIGRIAFYRAIRSAIKNVTAAFKEGYENLYRWSRLNDGEFSTSMDKLATEALHVKNALGASLAPIINAMVPVVEKLAHAFINVVNAVNQFISAITGASAWTKALHTPITYAQAAGSGFDKATKKAKEYKNTLLGFDEINRLNDNNDSSNASSTSSELPYGSMFEKLPLGDFWKKWMNLEDWTELGSMFAKKANEFLKSADDWILNTARPWAMKWSTRIATFLNGFVKDFDWELMGKTVADGMMVIVDSVNNFFEKFQAVDFGKGIGRTINSWFANIQWDAIGKFFTNKLNFLIDVAYGFLTEFVKDAPKHGARLALAFKTWVTSIKWEELRGVIRLGLKSIADMIEGFVTNQDGAWDKFKTEFITTVQEIFQNPDLERITTAIGNFITEIAILVGDLPWYDIGHAIGVALAKVNWVEVFKSAGEAIVKGLWGATWGFFDTWITERAQGIAERVARPADSMATSMENSVTRINRATNEMTSNFDINSSKTNNSLSRMTENISSSMQTAGKGFNSGLKIMSDGMSGFSDDISNSFGSITGNLSTQFDNLGAAATRAVERVRSYFNSVSSSTNSAISRMNSIRVPKHANGGMVEDGLFLANHTELVGQFSNGKTAVANNAQIVEGIKAGVYEAMMAASSNSGNSTPGTFVLNVNGREFCRATYNDMKAVEKEKGISLIQNFG